MNESIEFLTREDHATRHGMNRNPDHTTSIKAARGVRRITLREQVIHYATSYGSLGFTDDDLKVNWPSKPESSLRKRRTELAQENVILDTGATRKNSHGQDEKVWVHRDFHPSPPPIIERDTTPKQSKLARAEALVAELADVVRSFYVGVETGKLIAPVEDEVLAAITARAKRALDKLL